MQSGYKGISFPFRITQQGGVAMSTTSESNPQHIVESIKQILNTHYGERVMEADVYSDLATSLFEPNEVGLQEVIKSRIVDAIRNLDERVECEEDDIEFKIEDVNGYSYLYANINFKIVKYNTWYNESFKVGEISNG